MRVEPASGLVDRFADEIGWKLRLELRFARMGISPLCKGHRPAVVPAIDHFGDSHHASPWCIGGIVGHRVDVGFVDLEILGQFGIGRLGLGPHVGSIDAGF